MYYYLILLFLLVIGYDHYRSRIYNSCWQQMRSFGTDIGSTIYRTIECGLVSDVRSMACERHGLAVGLVRLTPVYLLPVSTVQQVMHEMIVVNLRALVWNVLLYRKLFAVIAPHYAILLYALFCYLWVEWGVYLGLVGCLYVYLRYPGIELRRIFFVLTSAELYLTAGLFQKPSG